MVAWSRAVVVETGRVLFFAEYLTSEATKEFLLNPAGTGNDKTHIVHFFTLEKLFSIQRHVIVKTQKYSQKIIFILSCEVYIKTACCLCLSLN